MKGKRSLRTTPCAVAWCQPRADLAALAGAIILLIMVPAVAASSTLAKDGYTAYHIVPAAQDTSLTGHAADELATYLQSATGAHFVVSAEYSDGPAIRLDTRTCSQLGLNYRSNLLMDLAPWNGEYYETTNGSGSRTSCPAKPPIGA